MDASHAAGYCQRALALAGQQQYQQALDDCSQALRINAEQVLVYKTRAAVYAQAANHTQAVADLTQGIFLALGAGRAKPAPNGQYRIDPLLAGQDDLYRQRGDEYLAQGEFDRAIADYSKAIQLNPANGDAYFARGSALLSKGSSALADQDLAQAARLREPAPERR